MTMKTECTLYCMKHFQRMWNRHYSVKVTACQDILLEALSNYDNTWTLQNMKNKKRPIMMIATDIMQQHSFKLLRQGGWRKNSHSVSFYVYNTLCTSYIQQLKIYGPSWNWSNTTQWGCKRGLFPCKSICKPKFWHRPWKSRLLRQIMILISI